LTLFQTRVKVAHGHGFDFHGTEQDIFIVEPDGRYETIDASDLDTPNEKNLDQVRTVLLNKLHLREI
jgi:hypothetical protein